MVAADERETGQRAILNFGHTFGHAIEAVTDYRRYLHGEAVALGMAMAMHLSVELGRATEAEAERVHKLLVRAGLPSTTALSPAPILEAMSMDKKVVDGRIRLVVCDGIGRVSVTPEAPRSSVLDAVESAINPEPSRPTDVMRQH